MSEFESYHSLDGEQQYMITEKKLIEITKWKTCFQRLKKRMKECKGNTNEMKVGTTDYNYQIRLATELQKILGEKK